MSFEVSFREVDPFNFWIWLRFLDVPSKGEKDYIDALALSKKFQISEIEIRQKITKAQNKKFIPFGVEIK